MLENLLFCLNATMPLLLMMGLGMFFMKIGVFDDHFVKKMNGFVFRISLPILVFYDLGTQDFREIWDFRFVAFCFVATCGEIALSMLLAYGLKNKRNRGEFMQVAFRSSAALLGVTLVENIYGNAGMVPLMILGAVPLYNIMSVVILSLYKPEREPMSGELLKKTFIDVIKNPILIGVFAGLIWSLLKMPMPVILDRTLSGVARTATPLGIMAMGATFDIKKALSSVREAGFATFMKLVGFGLIILPIAIKMGFTESKLVAALIMCGSASTVSCYVMAKEMGHDGTLSSSTVMLTTLLTAFTLTGWLFVFRTMGLL